MTDSSFGKMLYVGYKYEYLVNIVTLTCNDCGTTFELQEGEYFYNSDRGKSSGQTVWLTCPNCYKYHSNYSGPSNARQEWVNRTKVVNFNKHNIQWRVIDSNGTVTGPNDYYVTDIEKDALPSPYVRTGTPDILVDRNGGKVVIHVSSDTNWSITAGDGWCYINPQSGRGDMAVTLTLDSTSAARSTTITVNALDDDGQVTATQTYTVNQSESASPGPGPGPQPTDKYLRVSRNSITLGAEAIEFDGIEITSNTTWTVSVKTDDSPADFDGYVTAFTDVTVPKSGTTYSYLEELYNEAYAQYYDGSSVNGLPSLHKSSNYPVMYSFGSVSNEQAAFDSLVGWLFALQLAELKPRKRTSIFKTGYEMGGYDRYDNVYGYDFRSDPNYARMTAAAIYAAMRGLKQPNISAMRSEVGGSSYSKIFKDLANGTRTDVGEGDFFIDFREFMPTAPGPYAPGYTTRPDRTFPNEPRDEYDNLQKDRDIHEDIITKYNLSNSSYKQATVQAIADKEGDESHLFGKNRTTTNYSFHPVFGTDTIGIEIAPDGAVAYLSGYSEYSSSSARIILQSADVTPVQYGRLRPGCSWSQEARKNSSTDDRRNILTNWEIEENDGHPTGYYDSYGNWIKPTEVSSPEEYEELQKNSLYANSYPSGHSSGIMGAALVLIEVMPSRADKILKEMNQFAVNRTIARYHWTSDTINGRVLGSAQNAVGHAASDYDSRLSAAREELNGGGGTVPESGVNRDVCLYVSLTNTGSPRALNSHVRFELEDGTYIHIYRSGSAENNAAYAGIQNKYTVSGGWTFNNELVFVGSIPDKYRLLCHAYGLAYVCPDDARISDFGDYYYDNTKTKSAYYGSNGWVTGSDKTELVNSFVSVFDNYQGRKLKSNVLIYYYDSNNVEQHISGTLTSVCYYNAKTETDYDNIGLYFVNGKSNTSSSSKSGVKFKVTFSG